MLYFIKNNKDLGEEFSDFGGPELATTFTETLPDVTHRRTLTHAHADYFGDAFEINLDTEGVRLIP